VVLGEPEREALQAAAVSALGLRRLRQGQAGEALGRRADRPAVPGRRIARPVREELAVGSRGRDSPELEGGAAGAQLVDLEGELEREVLADGLGE